MELINLFALIGMTINDLLAVFSVFGSVILLFGAFSKAPLKRYGNIADISILGLIFGGIFQISMTVTDTTPKLIGALLPMPALMVNALLAVSFLMLLGRWIIKRVLNKS